MKKKKIWVNVAKSFKEAEEFDKRYYMAMSGEERLDTMQLLREMHYKIKGVKNAGGKRLRRVVRIIQQKQR